MAKWNRRALCLMAGAVLVPGLTVSSAVAAPTAGQQATTACKALSMSVTTGGDHIERDFAATTPPSQTLEVKGAVGAFPQARLAGAMLAESVAPGTRFSGWMIFGDAMYKVGYQADAARKLVPGTLVKTRVGGGWSTFTDFETSRYNESATVHRVSQYALRSDGTLFRWTMSGDTWTKPVSAAGFSSVRTMALISQTRTYDTFVASTKGGSLYTVHLPTDATMKPTVKQISAPQNGWQSYIDMIAQRCGQYGMLLLAIDRNFGSGKLFAVGHGNGMATVINDLGWVSDDAFPDPVNFGWVPGANPPLNGE